MKAKFLVLGLMVALAAFLPAVTARAQGDAPYRISDKELRDLLKRTKDDSDRFRKSPGNALDDSYLNGTRREDSLNAYVKAFYKETDRLLDRFDHHKSVAADVQSVLDRAARIDRFMRNHPELHDRSQRDWDRVRADLDELAKAYNVTYDWNAVP